MNSFTTNMSYYGVISPDESHNRTVFATDVLLVFRNIYDRLKLRVCELTIELPK